MATLNCETDHEANFDQVIVEVEDSANHPVLKIQTESLECQAVATVTKRCNGQRSLSIGCSDDRYELFATSRGAYTCLVRYAHLGPTGVWAIQFSCVPQ